MKWRRFLVLAAIAVAMVVAVSAVVLGRPASEEHQPLGASFVHAAGEGSMGCATCHTSPIVSANCNSCHLTSGNDARFVTSPDAGHDFCSSCHGPKHSDD